MFKQISLSTVAGLGMVAMMSLANPQTALALLATTTFSDLDGLPSGVDEAIFNWSTNLTSGTVTNNDLTDWTILLNSGGSTIYTDNVIIGSSVQPIGGVNRSVVSFSYDFGSNTLTSFDNDFATVQNGAATGTTYNIWGNVGAPFFSLREYNNGSEVNFGLDNSFTQTTTATPVPFEMSPTLGLLMVGGIWGVNRLRKSRKSLTK